MTPGEHHPNRLTFEGLLTLLDVPSDKAPSGARGHRVILTRAAAKAALPTLLGMAIDFKAGWDGHDARQKCGIITEAVIEGRELKVAGYLFARDFPELERRLVDSTRMGMSYELIDAHVADLQSTIWKLTRVTFTGAAILLREKAAYRSTSFRLVRPAALAIAASAGGDGNRYGGRKEDTRAHSEEGGCEAEEGSQNTETQGETIRAVCGVGARDGSLEGAAAEASHVRAGVPG